MIKSRVQTLVGLLVLTFCLFGSSGASAAPSEARQELEKTISQVLAELQKPELKQASGRTAVLGRVERIIEQLFSFEELSARTVGASWKSFSPDQKKRFIAAFTTLLRETYLEKLDGYNGETVSYGAETSNQKGDKAEIATTVSIRGKAVPVAYRMLKKSRWEVYDVIIEGISMVQNYRSQFQQLLASGDAEKLIELVRVKGEEARVNNKKLQTGS